MLRRILVISAAAASIAGASVVPAQSASIRDIVRDAMKTASSYADAGVANYESGDHSSYIPRRARTLSTASLSSARSVSSLRSTSVRSVSSLQRPALRRNIAQNAASPKTTQVASGPQQTIGAQ